MGNGQGAMGNGQGAMGEGQGAMEIGNRPAAKQSAITMVNRQWAMPIDSLQSAIVNQQPLKSTT
jgi:hypothetical protein